MTSWLNINKAAKYLGISKTQLYQLAKDSKIPSSRAGKQWRFQAKQLDQWLENSVKISDFFIKANYSIEENDSLRDPQRNAYLAVYDHFQKNTSTAIVQLPVGCGKSGLASILPFGLSRGRVLLITPNLTIKQEVRDVLDVAHRKCFWNFTHVLSKKSLVYGPFVTTLDESNLTIVEKSHFVVTNVQQLSTNPEKWLKKFKPDFFDMIIVDEAHHSPASSWQKVFDYFSKAKVVFLTATPFRSDKKEVKGTLVYRYSFQEASSKGYIKRLKASYVSPIELTFTMDGESKTFSLKEVLKLKEKDWFSRGVALSEVTNVSIVDNSLTKLEELRDSTGTQHQLIAVAMSISHAKMIATLYEERGYNVDVIHSKLSKEKKKEVINSLRNGTLDCIIQVQMLGEGFNHPKLSVAAIFRPFRSLPPYIQFVGRIMRVIIQNEPRHPDNYGHIVTHIGLNLDELLKQFQLFDKNDEDFWASLLGGDDPPPPKKVIEGLTRMKMQQDMVVNDEIVEHLYQEEFIEDENLRKEELKRRMSELGFDPSQVDNLMPVKDKKGKQLALAAIPLPVQPQQAWKYKRRRLNIDVKTKAKILLNTCGLSPAGRDILNYRIGIKATSNLVAGIMMFNKEVQKIIGKKDERGEWASEDFDKAVAALPAIGKKLVKKIKAVQNG